MVQWVDGGEECHWHQLHVTLTVIRQIQPSVRAGNDLTFLRIISYKQAEEDCENQAVLLVF